jgi:hypothetical protein
MNEGLHAAIAPAIPDSGQRPTNLPQQSLYYVAKYMISYQQIFSVLKTSVFGTSI